MPPIITKHGHDWVFVYDDAVQIRARNPSTRFGRPTVEIQVTIRPQYQPTGSGRVYWGTLGLLSKSGVANAVKMCAQNADGFPWPTIIDDFCWTMMELAAEARALPHAGKTEPDRSQAVSMIFTPCSSRMNRPSCTAIPVWGNPS